MPAVQFNSENMDACLCPGCPVQMESECAKSKREKVVAPALQEERLPIPNETPAIYCSSIVGATPCSDFNINAECLCPSCRVWTNLDLSSTYYCSRGSAEMIG